MAEALDEVKSLFEKGQTEVTALRTEFDELKGKAADYVTADKISKIEADLAATIAKEQKAAADLQAEREAKTALDERLSALETAGNRPGSASKEGAGADDMKSFEQWTRGRESDFESKAMSEDSDPDGGYFVPPTMRDGIQARMRRSSPVRSVANIVTIGANRYEMLVERGDSGFEWTGEKENRSETTTPDVNKISIDLHELSAMPKVTSRLLNDSEFDVAGFLSSRIADRFGRGEALAFVKGDGVKQPRGFLTYKTATEQDEQRGSGALQYVPSGASGGFDASNPADAFIDLVYRLQSGYREGSVWMMKSTVAASVAKFKDGDGNYLLHRVMDGNGAVVSQLLGYRLVEAEDMPDLAADAFSVAFGNFGLGYTIADNPGVQMLRDPYSAKPHVLFYTTKRTGGGVTDFDAIKLMKLSAT